jgi:polyferredoxin
VSRRVPLPTHGPLVDQPRGFDLFRLPGLRRFVRWRYARLALQLPLLILAAFVIVDGLTGRQLAPRNVATTATWLHYRGLVVVALALVGNAFCAACPLMLTRGPANALKRALPFELRWPRWARNKWLVVALLLAIFYAYEAYDLWASPWLTAWLAIAYFVGAFAIDALFPAGTFCRYVCPLGNFNFVLSSVSPTQIAAVDADVCRSCEDKPCLHGRESRADPAAARSDLAFIPLDEVRNANGAGTFPGCETQLFVPTMTSSMDCTACMNCVRACPYDNVALRLRSPARELSRDVWRRRWGLPVLVMGILLLFWGLLNAVAMVPPFYDFADWLSRITGSRSEPFLLALVFALVSLVGLGLATAGAVVADLAGGAGFAPRAALMRWGYVFVALAFGFWTAHYLFHFLTGAASIVPVFQHFFEWRGAAIDPDWRLARWVPSGWLFPLTAGVSGLYALLASYLTVRIALRDFGRRGAAAMWPMLALVIGLAVFQLLVLAQPMEMRGTLLGPVL